MQVHFLKTLPFAHNPTGCMEASTGERKANAVLCALAVSSWLSLSVLLAQSFPCWQDGHGLLPFSAGEHTTFCVHV